MKRIAYVVICLMIVVAISACAGKAVSWDQFEESIFEEFTLLQSQVEESVSNYHVNAPASYNDSKFVADFVWDWKAYENSCIAEIYSEWRQSAGIAIERVAGLHFYKESDPNIAKVRSEAEFHQKDWMENTNRVKDAVQLLKDGGNPLN